MNNENLEGQVHKKKHSSKVLFIVLGLIVLGMVSLYGGIKIFSKLSVSADELPPVPGDPLPDVSSVASAVASTTTSAVSSATATVSHTPTPPTPPGPGGPPINVTISSGWSMISGTTLYSYNVAPITSRGIFVYSFNDPYLSNRNWIVSSPNCTNQVDYFCLTSSAVKFAPYPSVGYYVYNPGSQVTLSLDQVTSPTLDTRDSIFGRGWHLMYYPGVAATKDELLSKFAISYSDSSALNLLDSIKEAFHTSSMKIYVVVNSGDVSASSIKELTDTDSSTTISKIPQNSYFWVYLRRTKVRAVQISGPTTGGVTSSPLPNASAISNVVFPPVPTNP